MVEMDTLKDATEHEITFRPLSEMPTARKAILHTGRDGVWMRLGAEVDGLVELCYGSDRLHFGSQCVT